MHIASLEFFELTGATTNLFAMSALAIELAPGVYRIPTMGSGINSFLFKESDGSLSLVDCGVKGAHKKISSAIKSLNHDMSDVNRIIFTHSHDDHVGGAAKVIELVGKTEIIAHEEEEKYFESGKNPPQDYSHFAGLFFRFLPSGGFTPITINQTVKDGELLSVGGGLRVIHTPGHTPGHVSLLHEPSGTLITGDSVFNFGFKIAWSLSAFCTNFEESKKTALKFLDIDYRIAAFTHGPHIEDGRKQALKKFLRSKS